jgi:DNA-binding beta-propeller fold protein YncE
MNTRMLLTVGILLSAGLSGQDVRPVGRAAEGQIVLPVPQMLKPAGFQVEFPGRPTDLLLLDGGGTLVVKGKNDLLFIGTGDRVIRQSLRVPRGGLSFHGVAASADERRIYVTGASGTLRVARRENGVASWERAIPLPGPGGKGRSAPGGIWLRNATTAYVALSRNNAIGVVDLERGIVHEEIPVGVAPYGLAAWRDLLCVTNWGGRRARAGDETDLSSGTEVVVDPVTNVAASGTVTLIDLKEHRVLGHVEVGLHPTDLAIDSVRGLAYVANANSDSISVLDLARRQVVRTLSVRPHRELPFGSSPNALALTRDGQRLYVANGTNNAVAVLEPRSDAPAVGFLPVGWYPGGLALDERRGWLHVANTKGVGSRHARTGRAGFNSHDHRGSVSILTDLGEEALSAGSATVSRLNRHDELRQRLLPARPDRKPVPVPERHGEPSVFEHVLYIIKENRTYDQVLGDLPQGNGDPSLCIFGREVTPNHHALAEEFVLLDGFYCSGILSADGHQWTNEAFVTDYLEKMFGGFSRSYPYAGDDPLAYAPTGFLWDNALRHGRSFRCYGEMVQASIEPRGTFKEIYDDFVAGGDRFRIRASAHIDAISENMCPTFIGFPSIVPDVYRAGEFIKELEGFERSGEMPNLMMMLLPNDHTAGTRPGMPTPRAAVADNDLALGRIVEAVSRSRFWPKTCIFVVQDDPQAGWDHVDGHRTVALVISPYTRRGAVISERYTQPSMVKTIELVLGLPPMNQMDLFATPMTACFTSEANTTPYTCRPARIALDELNLALHHLEGPALRDALASLKLNLDEIDQADEEAFNRILWHAAKGHDTPYPVRHTNAGRTR